MPKKFAIVQLREWLEHYEQGESEISIARGAHCDVRTVKKGIEQARLERDAAAARADLIREALRKHQGRLLSIIDEIVSKLAISYSDSGLLDWNVARSQESEAIPADLQLGSEHTQEWGLLQEHLKGDPMWKALAQRKGALATFLNAKWTFRRKALALLESRTGTKLVDDRAAVLPPVAYISSMGPLFFEAAIRECLAIPYGRDLERDINIDADRGIVYGRTVIAEVPGKEEDWKRNVLAALKELLASPEALEAAKTYGELEEYTERARNAAQEVHLVGMVPSRCRVCRRLGM